MANFPGTPGDDLFFGTAGSDTMTGAGGNDKLYGLQNDDTLDGGDGNDILDGGTGADNMTGGIGDDVYVVDNVGDVIIEASGGGSDLVYTLGVARYFLPPEVERAAVYSRSSVGSVELYGNALDNELIGNDGRNVLDGFGGQDIMQGAGGDDGYTVSLQGTITISHQPSGSDLPAFGYQYLNSSAPDIVIEHTGGGFDNILVPFTGSPTAHNWFDYTLIKGSSFTQTGWVERLSVFDFASTYAVNLQGDILDNVIAGNAGQNILDGWTGADRLIGFEGDDTYFVDVEGDDVVEQANEGFDTIYITTYPAQAGGGPNPTEYQMTNEVERLIALTPGIAFTLAGNTRNNEIVGNDSANLIDGRDGVDLLMGLGGADTFRFTSLLGPGNVDQIRDFQVGVDRIALEDTVFAGVTPDPVFSTQPPRALDAGAFRSGSAAQDADDRIIYDPTTGALFFDSDGNGSAQQVQFATVHEGLSLSSADFVII